MTTPPFFGNLVNFFAIIFGSLTGLVVGRRFHEEIKNTVLAGIGLFCFVLGVSLYLEEELSIWAALAVIISLVSGGIVGEILGIEEKLDKLGSWLEEKTVTGTSTYYDEARLERKRKFIQSFVSASLIFCVGPLAIIGSFEDALGNPELLLAKSALDGTVSIAFASTLGMGVLFSAFVVLAYQGSITLLSLFIADLVPELVITTMSATGGVLIIGLGINLTGIGKVKVGNLLPALLIVGILTLIFL
ncbi:MAG: DUF554 domain-containing protein [Candidatus Hodarchaeota archaeon]